MRPNQEFPTAIGFERKDIKYPTFKADSQKTKKSANAQYNTGTPQNITNMQKNQ
jgi:hypothetical protein